MVLLCGGIRKQAILGDPGAVSGDGEKSKAGDEKFRPRKVKLFFA